MFQCALPLPEGRAIAYGNRKANKAESSLERVDEKRAAIPRSFCICDSPAPEGHVGVLGAWDVMRCARPSRRALGKHLKPKLGTRKLPNRQQPSRWPRKPAHSGASEGPVNLLSNFAKKESRT
jgi:hypothetical protein